MKERKRTTRCHFTLLYNLLCGGIQGHEDVCTPTQINKEEYAANDFVFLISFSAPGQKSREKELGIGLAVRKWIMRKVTGIHFLAHQHKHPQIAGERRENDRFAGFLSLTNCFSFFYWTGQNTEIHSVRSK